MSGETKIGIGAIRELVERCTREVADQENADLPGSLNVETPLFGKRGIFDSLGVVSLVLAVEEAIREEHGEEDSLADERAMSQERSPFRTVGSLADYAAKLIEEAH